MASTLAIVFISAGQYCLLALAFAFVWWSSWTFFVAGAVLIPIVGAVLFNLVFSRGIGLVSAGFVAVLTCIALAAAIEVGVMCPMAGWRSRSGHGWLSESAVLDGAGKPAVITLNVKAFRTVNCFGERRG